MNYWLWGVRDLVFKISVCWGSFHVDTEVRQCIILMERDRCWAVKSEMVASEQAER